MVGGNGRCNNVGGHVAQIEAGLLVFCAGAGDDLAEERGHVGLPCRRSQGFGGEMGIFGLCLSIDVSIAWVNVYTNESDSRWGGGSVETGLPLGVLCVWFGIETLDCLVSRSSWVMRRHRFSSPRVEVGCLAFGIQPLSARCSHSAPAGCCVPSSSSGLLGAGEDVEQTGLDSQATAGPMIQARDCGTVQGNKTIRKRETSASVS